MWFVDKLGPAPRPTPPVSGATPYDAGRAAAGARQQPSAKAAPAKGAPPAPEQKKEKKKGWF